MKHVISYLRVSTVRQGQSGLGLEAQRAAVEQFCHQHGCEVLAEFVEVESGRKSDRPVLRQALALGKAKRATLLIAKLDRLARNVHFISGLMESGVEFRACDLPDCSRFILHVMAAVAEQEARAISDRTRAALKAAKARGILLGASNAASRNLSDEARRRGARRTAEVAATSYAEVSPVVQELRVGGLSLQAIALELDARGLFTRTGRPWNAVQVSRVLKYAAV
jgi:DNA invertase Pin-like site-specific DNA recombinase